MEVARVMGKKVYVSKEKMQILQCCDLPREYASLLTTDHLETNIHAVSTVAVQSRSRQMNIARDTHLLPGAPVTLEIVKEISGYLKVYFLFFHPGRMFSMYPHCGKDVNPCNHCQVPLFKINAQEMSGILEN